MAIYFVYLSIQLTDNDALKKRTKKTRREGESNGAFVLQKPNYIAKKGSIHKWRHKKSDKASIVHKTTNSSL